VYRTHRKRSNALRPAWVRLIKEVDPSQPEPVQVRGPVDAVALLRDRANRELVEVFYVIVLNTQSRVIAIQEVTRGILNSSLVHPREVFRLAIAFGAAGVIVAHNHPSGDTTPSADDRTITRQLVDAGRLLDIPVYDHLVLGAERYLSFAESGLL
jgi:DNA repair protein RadC